MKRIGSVLTGRPIWAPRACQRVPSKRARSVVVATQTAPSGVSANCHGEPDGSPSALLNTCQRPSLRKAIPPNVKPTHKPPPRGAKAEDTLNDESFGSWGRSTRSNAIPSKRNRPLGLAIHRYPSCVCARASAPPSGAPWLGPQAVWCSSLMVRSGLSAAAQPHQSSVAIANPSGNLPCLPAPAARNHPQFTAPSNHCQTPYFNEKVDQGALVKS